MNTTPAFACAAYLSASIQRLQPPKSIEQIAHEAGFRRAVMLEAVLSGEVALPMDRTFHLAGVVRCDRAELFKLAMKDHRLDRTLLPMLEALDEFMVTEEELHLLGLVRKRLAGRDLFMTDAVEEWVETFPPEAT